VTATRSGVVCRNRPLLPDELALLVESVAKRHSSTRALRYEPTRSLFARFADQRLGVGGGAGGGDDEDEDEDEGPATQDAFDELAGVTLSVRRGEAVAVLAGRQSGAQTLARILCGMLAPAEGRILVRGRIGPSFELARILSRREAHPREAARMLARMSGVPRGARRAYVDETLRLAFGDGDGGGTLQAQLRRVAHAAALDPLADVLVVDRLPEAREAAFRARSLRRLEESLAGGAGAVVVVRDEDDPVLGLCSEGVWLEGGSVAAAGSVDDVVHGFRDAVRAGAQRQQRLRAFNRHAALHRVEIFGVDGRPLDIVDTRDELRVRIRLETAREEVSIACRLAFDGARSGWFSQEPTVLSAAGEYDVWLALEPGTLQEGTYSVDAYVAVESERARTRIGRRAAASVAVEGRPVETFEAGGETPLAAAGSAEGSWSVEALVDDSVT
jgi:ABC-type polysaccharide/polyol phosphate transport system ATPase subunit